MGLPRAFAFALLPILSFSLLCAEVYSASPQTTGSDHVAGAAPPIDRPEEIAVNKPSTMTYSDGVVATPKDGGIREEIPLRFQGRFSKWKAELLSTRFGKSQWDRYANDKNFLLKIAIAEERKRGARTDKFLWDTNGKLVSATITLGPRLDEGYPNPIYYPVLNALSSNGCYRISGEILAASKLSHELGHVEDAAATEMSSLRTRERLIPIYTSILRKNGRNVNAHELTEIVRQMGGSPVQITEDREYRSESFAMRYLSERILDEPFYCFVFANIRRNVKTYAKGYEKYFDFDELFSASVCVSN